MLSGLCAIWQKVFFSAQPQFGLQSGTPCKGKGV